MSEISLENLESKVAFLEQHIEEQDKVILKVRGRLDQLIHEMEHLKSAIQESPSPRTGSDEERPPHY